MPVRLVANSEGARPCAKHQPQQCNSFCGWVSPQPRSTDALAANRIGTLRSLLALAVAAACSFLSGIVTLNGAEQIKLGTNAIVAGKVLEFEAPLSAHAKINARRTSNPKVETAKGAVAVPEGFDPLKNWPLLIVSATSDGSASSIGAMKRFIQLATEAGWVILAADGPSGKPKEDSDAWRWAMILGVLDHLRAEWPESRKWPIACAGFSGGAKRSALIAAIMMKGSYKLSGIFMGGCNQDSATSGFLVYQPGPQFRRLPIFLSSGTTDTIATPEQHAAVKQSMDRSGFANVRLETYDGGHQLNADQVKTALKWFQTKGSK